MPAGSLARLTLLLSLFSLFSCRSSDTPQKPNGSVYCMSRDGSGVQQLSAEGAATPIWAPDGRRLLYVIHTPTQTAFQVISASGEVLMTIPLPPPLTLVGGVSWHPGGKEIAFAGSEGSEGLYDIYRIRLGEGEPPRRIVSDGILPAWLPDGQLLAFTTYRDGNLEVYVVDEAGRNPRNLTRHEGLDARPSVSPDGSRIAFESDRFGNLDICIVEIASGDVVRVTDHPGDDWNPAWSPDGREIAFVSDRDGKSGIYCGAVDGTSVRRFSSGHEGDWQLAWSPDGKSICFVSNRPESFF